MVNATSISEHRDAWTRRLTELGNRFGVVVHLVHISGRRRAYLAGRTGADVPMMTAHTWDIAPRLEAVVYADKKLTEPRRKALEEELASLCTDANR
jgi:hypothetical protein